MVLSKSELKSRATNIKLLVLDVDGVLTDGRLTYSEDGETVKQFNAKDGLGMNTAVFHGIEVAIITARDSGPLRKRMEDLQIEHFYPGQSNKIAAYNELKAKLGLDDAEVAYMGDDVLDLPVMREVGLAMCPYDAVSLVTDICAWRATIDGGHGCVREAVDMLLAARMPLATAYEAILNAKASKHRGQ